MLKFTIVAVVAMLCCLAALVIAGEIPVWVVVTSLVVCVATLVSGAFQDRHPLQGGG